MSQKSIPLFFILPVFLMILSNCTGINGNPTELTGTWKASFDVKDNGGTVQKTITLTIKNNGNFTYEYDQTGAGTDEKAVVYGTIIGDPTNNPKRAMIYIDSKKYTYGSESNTHSNDGETASFEYYIQWIGGKQKLFITVGSLAEDVYDDNDIYVGQSDGDLVAQYTRQ